MNQLPERWGITSIGSLNQFSSRTIDPAKSPNQWFELYSVPSSSTGNPEIVQGAKIGSTKISVASGDVLVCKINPRINRVWSVADSGKHPQIASSEWIVVRAPQVDSRYLKHYFSSPKFRELICQDLTGVGGSLTRAQPKRVATFPVPVAPSNEQKRIADKLDTLLARVEAVNDRLARVAPLLKRFRQSVLAAATSGTLTEDWRLAKSLPYPWKTCLTKEAGSVQLGRQRSPKYHTGANMRPYLRVQNVFEDRIDLSDVMEMDFPPGDFDRYRLHAGDILLNEGQSPEYLGRPAMYRGELEGACFTNTLIRFKAHAHVVPDFALLVFRNYMHAGRYIEAGTTTTNIAHLGAGRFGNVEFPLPTTEEQREIVRRAGLLFTYADRLEARLQAAQTAAERLTPALLAKAFRGELVPHDPNDEPAAELLRRLKENQSGTATPAKKSRGAGKKAT